MRVYADYAATGPVKKEVLEAMLPYLTDDFGNASSMHEWGRAARIAIDRARTQVANFLGATESEIVFTSGGTESDNLAIKGIIAQDTRNKTQETKEKTLPHIITSQIEHHAVLRSCESLEKSGLAEVTYIKPNTNGIIEIRDIEKAIKDNTVLVSIMYVNNEIGTVQPIAEIGKLIKKINESRKLAAISYQPILFHTDAVQAAEYQEMNVDALHVDLLTLSGHKIGAPKGIGVLYIRKGVRILPIMHGGEQEFNRRAGTENTAGIVAIGKAVEIVQSSKSKVQSLSELRDYFIERILKEIPETSLNGSKEFRSPNNINIYFKYVEGESILMNLDLVGIAASSGSACTSLSLQPSHVIMAMCDDAEHAHGSIRFTISADTSKEQVDYIVDNLKEIINKLRKMSPLAPKQYKF